MALLDELALISLDARVADFNLCFFRIRLCDLDVPAHNQKYCFAVHPVVALTTSSDSDSDSGSGANLLPSALIAFIYSSNKLFLDALATTRGRSRGRSSL